MKYPLDVSALISLGVLQHEFHQRTVNGHLLELARANGSVLATHDRGIPGAVLIPV